MALTHARLVDGTGAVARADQTVIINGTLIQSVGPSATTAVPGFLPGFGNLRNYELLVEAGFAPEQAIQIMTLNGARILGLDKQLGSIAPGKIADMMVVRGNPLTTTADIYGVVTVFKDGVGYDAAQLLQGAKGRVGVD